MHAPRLPFPGLSGIVTRINELEAESRRLSEQGESLARDVSRLTRTASRWRAIAAGISVVAAAEFLLLWARP